MTPVTASEADPVLPVLSSTQHLEVALLLCEGVPFDDVAVELDLDRAAVRTAALSMGYPDRSKLIASRDRWGAAVDNQVANPDERVANRDAMVATPASVKPGMGDLQSLARLSERSAQIAAAREDSAAAGLRFDDIPVRDLLPDPANPREDDTDGVEDLAESIRTAGLLQPIVARLANGAAVVVAGHRRLQAVRRLGWDTVPVIIRREMSSDEVLAAMLIENTQRKDLDPIQEARAVQQLMRSAGLTSAAQASARLGRHQTWVSNRLALLSLTPEDQRKVRAGEMTLGEAQQLGRLESGRVRRPGYTGVPHFSNQHDLSHLARARCTRLKHKSRGRNSVGGVACGECWETVIRANEREQISQDATDMGRCPTCDRTMP